MVQQANSGHPGAPMGLATVGHALFNKIMNYNPANPKFPNRDRFVLSNGHACALQYTLLHLSGYPLTLDDLKNFRQLGSKTPGHPESFRTPGVEVSTGPLGQGIANAVGFAIAQAHLSGVYNKPNFPLFDHYVYAICGDGCLQEGVALEAISLAGHLKLGRLIVLYDDNNIQIDGPTNMAFSDNTAEKFKAQGWHVQEVKDGDNDLEGIVKAVDAAKQVTDQPSIIIVKTTIGYMSTKQGTEHVHGSPLGPAELSKVKEKFGFDPSSSFVISQEVKELYSPITTKGEKLESSWNDILKQYTTAYPNEAEELKRRLNGQLPSNWLSSLPSWKQGDKALATRESSGLVLNALAKILPELVGGSADLTPSNKTWLNCSTAFSPDNHKGRYLRFGVREHAMIAIGNGLSAYGGIIPFTATFLNFIEYGFGAARLSSLSQHKQLFIMTHDSIGLGEDGPTHQPIEAAALLRATPGFYTFRPADGNEVAGSYAFAIQHQGPSVLCLSRQGLPHLSSSSADVVKKGAYQVKTTEAKGDGAPLVLIATGSEVEVALKAADVIIQDSSTPFKSVTVVSAPCLELYMEQSIEYRRSIIPLGSFVVSVEALSSFGWDRFSHSHVAMTTFGESAPTSKVYDYFGFTGPKVAVTANEQYKEYIESVGNNNNIAPLPVQYVKKWVNIPHKKH